MDELNEQQVAPQPNTSDLEIVCWSELEIENLDDYFHVS